MGEWTKGPWFVDPCSKFHVQAPADGAEPWSVAEVAPDCEFDLGRSAANAQLISAATEMVDALQLLLAVYDNPVELRRRGWRHVKAIKAARGALSKARGEKPQADLARGAGE